MEINTAPRKQIPYPFKNSGRAQRARIINLKKSPHELRPVSNQNPRGNGFFYIRIGSKVRGIIDIKQPLAGIFRKTRSNTLQLFGFLFREELMFRLTGGYAVFLRDSSRDLRKKLSLAGNTGFLYRDRCKRGLYIYEGLRRDFSTTNTKDSPTNTEKTELFLIDRRPNKNNSGAIGTIWGVSASPIGHESGPRIRFYPVFKPANFPWKRLGEKVPHTLKLMGLVSNTGFSL